MLRARVGVVMVALALTGVNAVRASAVARTTDAVCDFQGKASIAPGLSNTPRAQILRITGGLANIGSSCPRTTTSTPATARGTFTSTSASCSQNSLDGAPATGILKIVWNDASTSKVKLSVSNAVRGGNDLLVSLEGRVRQGLYAGDSVTAVAQATSTKHAVCGFDVVTGWTLATGSNNHMKRMTFQHASS